MREPGIYCDVPFAEYCAWEAVNNSSLGGLLKSPAHYRAEQLASDKDSDSLRFGRLVHQTALEPENLSKVYAVEPDFSEGIDSPRPWATNAYKERKREFQNSVGDRETVDAAWFDTCHQMLRSLWMHDRARQYLGHDGQAEASIVWDDPATGLRCKARIDKWDHRAHRLSDLKTTRDVCEFEKAIGNYSYHRQAAFYVDGMRHLTGDDYSFAIVAIDKSPPFSVRAAEVDDDSLTAGREQYRDCLQSLLTCSETGTWPGPEDPDKWRAPAWARVTKDVELVWE